MFKMYETKPRLTKEAQEASETLLKVDRNGSKHYEMKCNCDRCGGDGIYKWGAVINGVPQYMGTCFKCEGKGWVIEKIIERTPEYQAKLDARRKAKWEAEAKKAEEERLAREAEEARIKAEKEAELKAKKAISQFVGQVGERLNLTLTYIRTASFEVQSFRGWGTETMNIHILKDADGNTFTWKTTNGLGMDVSKDEYIRWKVAQEGDTVILKATVKEHTEYNEEKQTVLTRCKVIEIK